MNAIERLEEAIRGAELTEKIYGGHSLAPVMKNDAEAWLELARAVDGFIESTAKDSSGSSVIGDEIRYFVGGDGLIAALHRLRKDTP